jgi:hypothetical protein
VSPWLVASATISTSLSAGVDALDSGIGRVLVVGVVLVLIVRLENRDYDLRD